MKQFLKGAIIFIAIYFLVLLDTSFFVHFPIFGYTPNLVFIFCLIWNVLEDPKKKFGICVSIFGGTAVDIFSGGPFGAYILLLTGASLAIKFALKRYVRIPFIERT